MHDGTTRREPIPVGFAANHGFSPGDARGEAPCIRKQKISPFPGGEGGRGDGGDKANQRQGWQATSKARPPLGTAAARSAGNQPGKPPAPPAGRVIRAPAPVPPGFRPGAARGEAPCIRKQKISPFPPGRGLGGWGQQSKLKAGAAGDKEGKPPLRFRNGKVSRQPAGQVPPSPPRRARGSPLSTVPPGAPLQPNHAGITCCFGDNITKIP